MSLKSQSKERTEQDTVVLQAEVLAYRSRAVWKITLYKKYNKQFRRDHHEIKSGKVDRFLWVLAWKFSLFKKLVTAFSGWWNVKECQSNLLFVMFQH